MWLQIVGIIKICIISFENFDCKYFLRNCFFLISLLWSLNYLCSEIIYINVEYFTKCHAQNFKYWHIVHN